MNVSALIFVDNFISIWKSEIKEKMYVQLLPVKRIYVQIKFVVKLPLVDANNQSLVSAPPILKQASMFLGRLGSIFCVTWL